MAETISAPQATAPEAQPSNPVPRLALFDAGNGKSQLVWEVQTNTQADLADLDWDGLDPNHTGEVIYSTNDGSQILQTDTNIYGFEVNKPDGQVNSASADDLKAGAPDWLKEKEDKIEKVWISGGTIDAGIDNIPNTDDRRTEVNPFIQAHEIIHKAQEEGKLTNDTRPQPAAPAPDLDFTKMKRDEFEAAGYDFYDMAIIREENIDSPAAYDRYKADQAKSLDNLFEANRIGSKYWGDEPQKASRRSTREYLGQKKDSAKSVGKFVMAKGVSALGTAAKYDRKLDDIIMEQLDRARQGFIGLAGNIAVRHWLEDAKTKFDDRKKAKKAPRVVVKQEATLDKKRNKRPIKIEAQDLDDSPAKKPKLKVTFSENNQPVPSTDPMNQAGATAASEKTAQGVDGDKTATIQKLDYTIGVPTIRGQRKQV